MITDEVTHLIKCSSREVYEAEKARIQALPNVQAQVEYHDLLQQIVLKQTVVR